MAGSDISVIIPAHNVASYIGSTISSVLAQTFPSWECVVIDDGSSDSTADVVAGFTDSRIRLIRQPNQGVSTARNNGFAASSGATVLFLDGDDVLHPTALERLHRYLSAHPADVACFGTMLRLTPKGEIEPGQKATSLHSYASGDILEPIMVRSSTFSNGGQLLIRRAAMLSAGGYNPLLTLNEDWELWCRIAALGPIEYIGSDAEVLRLRVHPNSAATRLSPDWENHRRSIETVLSNSVLRLKFSPKVWQTISRRVRAAYMFEAGRQNFRLRKFKLARSLMFRALTSAPSKRRVAIFCLAQVSQMLNRPLIGRLRFLDQT